MEHTVCDVYCSLNDSTVSSRMADFECDLAELTDVSAQKYNDLDIRVTAEQRRLEDMVSLMKREIDQRVNTDDIDAKINAKLDVCLHGALRAAVVPIERAV